MGFITLLRYLQRLLIHSQILNKKLNVFSFITYMYLLFMCIMYEHSYFCSLVRVIVRKNGLFFRKYKKCSILNDTIVIFSY